VTTAHPTPARLQAMLMLNMLVWGINMPVVKWLTGHFDSLLLAGLRMLAAMLMMTLLLRGRTASLRLRRGQWVQLLLCGLCMVYLNQWFFVEGLRRSSATNGALIAALQPLVAALVAMVLLRERLGGRRLVGALLGIVGAALAILHRPVAQLVEAGVGDALVMLAVLVFCLGAVLTQRLVREMDAVVLTVLVHAIGAAALLGHAGIASLWSGDPPRAPPMGWLWAALLVSGLVSAGIGNLLWTRAISLIGMARASQWLHWVPIFGIATAAIFLGEPITRWHVAGLVLVLAGTRLGQGRG
jgi:drug/metabolite transporter (DMT)-like permease